MLIAALIGLLSANAEAQTAPNQQFANTPFQQVTSLPYPPNFNIYVNSITGSDSNDGRTYNTPIQNTTTAAANVQPGQSVCLENGSHWRQDFAPTVNNGTVTGCGPQGLPPPIVDGSDILPNANFVLAGGQTHTYVTNAPITFALSGTASFPILYESGGPGDPVNGQPLIMTTSIANAEATACSSFVATMTSTAAPQTPTTPQLVYVHPCDGSNAITNGYTYEIAQRTGIDIESHPGWTVMNVRTMKSANNNGSTVIPGDSANCTVINVEARNGGKHNMLLGGNCTGSYITLIDQYYPPGGTGMLVFNVTNGLGQNESFSNSILEQTLTISNNGAPQLVLSHTNVAGNFGTISLSNNFFLNQQSAGTVVNGINLTDVTNIVTSGNIFNELKNTIGWGAAPWLSTNDWLYTDIVNNQSVITNAASAVATLNNFKSCVKNAAATTGVNAFDNFGSATIVFNGGKLYVGSPNANSSVSVWNHATNGDSITFNGVDIGSGLASYTAIADGNNGTIKATFTGTGPNIYENGTGTPHWNLRNSSSLSTVGAWQSFLTGISESDAGATTSGGSASSACTLPTLPSVT